MTSEEKGKLYRDLSAPFTDEAIERTKGRITGKGYDTSGLKYQYVVNRLNEVLGIGGWRTQQELSVREVTTSKGRAAFDATCNVTIQFGQWADGKFVPWAEAFSTGGHQSVSEADARKGAFTNGLKKAAAMLGCGKQAYEGTLDDDNLALEEESAPVRQVAPPVRRAPEAPRPQTRPVEQVPQNIQRAPEAEDEGNRSHPQQTRNRLSSKQLAAIWAISRKLNYQQSQFRQEVKQRYGVQPEFLSKEAASQIIQALSARASNGASHPAGAHAEA